MKRLNAFLNSFPMKLLLVHIKHNQFLLVYWILLFATVNGNFAGNLGIPFLFLDPIYLDKVSFWGFLLIGVALSGFTMAFNITSYIIDGYRFPFLGTLPRPFTHFCLNNALIPLAFFVFYVIRIIEFQRDAALYSPGQTVLSLLGLLLGYVMMLTIQFIYFARTNKDIQKVMHRKELRKIKRSVKHRRNAFFQLKKLRRSKVRVSHYLSITFKFYSTRRYERYYDRLAILSIFKQNQRNAIMVQVFLLTILILLGAFQTSPVFQIPAAASAVLLLTMIVMATGAISFWLKGWTVSAIIGFFIIANLIFSILNLGYAYPAFGLNYHTGKADYSLEKLEALSTKEIIEASKQHWLRQLENWKSSTGLEEPSMILIAVSGGGQRSALWTMSVLQQADSVLEGRLMKETALITGASGGLIGAAFYRDLYWKDGSPQDSVHLEEVGVEVLNPIIFTLLINDLFVKARKVEFGDQTYKRDRGYEFEMNLSENLAGMLDRPLSDYQKAEFNGEIPALLVTPLITNDGRKLYISPQPVSFFNINPWYNTSIQGVDFRSLLKDQEADSLRFTTALRMSATFPYITPSMTLPTNPPIKIADAGISDNYGIHDAMLFVNVFKDWIKSNTSEVVLLSIRDSEKIEDIEAPESLNVIERFFSPIQNVYSSWDKVQTIKNDQLYELMEERMDGHLKRIEFELTPIKTGQGLGRASLSWRLTELEKKGIVEAIRSEKNKKRLAELALGFKPVIK